MLNKKILLFVFIILAMQHSVNINAKESKVILSIKIGIEQNKVPYSYKSMNGKIQGITINLLNVICKEIQAKCFITVANLDVLNNKLQRSELDAIITTNENIINKNVWSSKPLCILKPVYIMKKNALKMEYDLPIGYLKNSQYSSLLKEDISEYSYLLKRDIPKYKEYYLIEAAFIDLVTDRLSRILTTKSTAEYFLSKISNQYKITNLNVNKYLEMKLIGYDKKPKWLSKFNAVIKPPLLLSMCTTVDISNASQIHFSKESTND